MSSHRDAGMIAVRVTAIVICAVLLGSPSYAAPPKKINLANQSEPTGVYELGFCSRPSPVSSKGWPGHAFVSFSHSTSAGHDFMSIGHTITAGTSSAAAGWSLFGSAVGGLLKAENYTSVLENCLLVVVNKQDYDRAHALTVSPLQTMGLVRGPAIVFQAYKLASEDCVGFTISVAETLKSKGLKVPARNSLEGPASYIQRLIAAN
jgi:hypothetical protein